MNKLGERIFALRTERNMSQGDLANALDVSRQAVSKWENGLGTPTPENIVAMSILFGVTTDHILKGDAEKSEPAPPENVCAAQEPETDGLSKRKITQILGIILIAVGTVFSLAGLFLAVELLFVTFYMIIAGVLLLACKKHLGLILGWLTFAYVFIGGSVVSGRFIGFIFNGFLNFNIASIFSLLAVIAFAVLTVCTARSFYKSYKRRKNK